MIYTVLIASTVLMTIVASIAIDAPKRVLFYAAWYPFDTSNLLVFLIVYIYQIVAVIFGAFVHIACDTLVAGMILQISIQLKILNARLNFIPKVMHLGDPKLDLRQQENKQLSNCVKHHLIIFELSHFVF